jgi:hypothetical protein
MNLKCRTEIVAPEQVTMRTREGMADKRPGVLRLRNASVELAKLAFDEARPEPTAPPSSRK